MRVNKLTSPLYREQVNDIANLTFLSQSKNASIGKSPPWEYLTSETTAAIRRAHFIPENRDLWRLENFGKFMDARRRLLAAEINRLMASLQ